MLHIKQAVIVEGKYDKIKLSSIIDGLVLSTEGFRIFKDKEKRAIIRYLAQTNGIIVLTDSDSAGQLIRNHIKSITEDGKVIHVYVPRIQGKETRKEQPSKEGVLGVEGLPEKIIEQAFLQSGIIAEQKEKKDPITKTDLFFDGLSGCPKSGEKRKKLMESLGYPTYLSCNSMLELLNYTMGKEMYKKYLTNLEQEEL